MSAAYRAPASPLAEMPRHAAIARLCRPIAGINHILAYGQSLSSGWDGWPTLTQHSARGLLMLGHSVRPAEESGAVWRAIGPPVLRPLAATLQHCAETTLAPADAAGRLGGTLGETILETALGEFQARARLPAAQLLLASSCGVGARPLAALSFGATPDLFARLTDCAALARDIAAAPYAIAALLLLHGEHDNRALADGDPDGGTYLARLLALHDDFQQRVVAGIAGQSAPAAIFIHQTGGDYASDSCSIPQAQLDAALRIPTIFLAAPTYPMPSRGGHLDPNGYRWTGAQFGKVMHRVLTLGLDWKPLHPVRAFACGRSVHIDFHVPEPPLAFGRPFMGAARAAVADQGFTVIDPDGGIGIAEVVLDGPRSLRLTLARAPLPGARIAYADRHHHGRGGLHDSDPSVSTVHFVSLPDRPAPDLDGRPYALQNWCVAFNVALL